MATPSTLIPIEIDMGLLVGVLLNRSGTSILLMTLKNLCDMDCNSDLLCVYATQNIKSSHQSSLYTHGFSAKSAISLCFIVHET